jgi:DNA/RNA-binding domain of Phe-tRNA-synthetase-like protein
MLPQINTIVDLYNAISVKYKLAMGGHDLDKINGTVTLRMSNGNETYSALGSEAPITLPAGEYGYFDNENETLCRLDVKQCKKSLIDLSTNDTLIVFQGNRSTTKSYIDHAVSEFLALARAHLHAFNVQKIDF